MSDVAKMNQSCDAILDVGLYSNSRMGFTKTKGALFWENPKTDLEPKNPLTVRKKK